VTSAVGVCGRWLARTVLERGDQAVADEVTFPGQSGKAWRYWDDKPLGRTGGFGGVYVAEGPDGTPMAVKVVKKQRPSGVLDDRLLRREIDIGKRVADSGSEMLLPVIDAADAGDALLLVMPLADGALAAASVPMGEAEVVPVLVDIATGLQDLHSMGIIHRDLKPTNVLRYAGRWKLADFGIARDQEIGTQDPTFVGWGSFPYMAPELWELKSPTIKTDLYAVRDQLVESLPSYERVLGPNTYLPTCLRHRAGPGRPSPHPGIGRRSSHVRRSLPERKLPLVSSPGYREGCMT
jgi:serine/threonine protein kinase